MRQLYPCIVFLCAAACGGPLPSKSDSDTGGGAGPADVIEFGGVQILPAKFEFGPVEIGSESSETLVIDNDSPDAITVSNAFTEGTGFSLGSALSFPLELESGGIATGSVTFSPPGLGPFSGKLSIGIAGTVGYAEIPLKGSGIEEGTGTGSDTGSVTGSLGVLTPFPEDLAFGAIAVADTSWRTLQLTNTGEADVLISRLTSSNTFVFQVEPDFTVPNVLSAGETKTVQVGFSPAELREYTGILDVDADVAEGGILIPMSGTGSDSSCDVCAPVLSVSTSSGTTDSLDLTPPSGMGCTANGAVTLYNSGDMPLSVPSLELNNDLISTCGTFSYSWAGPLTLEPGTSGVIGVDFVATSTCMESTYPETDQNVMHIISNDPTTPDWVINLTGTALYCGG